MRPSVKKKLILAAAASSGLLGFVGYPAVKSVYPIKKQATIVDDYLNLPTATADLTKDITLPEGVGTGTDVPVDISHWLLLSLLKSRSTKRQERALEELARLRRWNDAECQEIAQALDRKDIVKLARTMDADLRLFLSPPSVDFIETTLKSNRIEKLVKSILKDVYENSDACSSCANFYTNLSIRVRPDSNALAMNDINQVDRMLHTEARKRKKSIYNQDLIKLKAVLNNIICSEEQALRMAQSGILVALLYFRHKYKGDIQVDGLLSQIVANLTAYPSTKDFVFTSGWIRILTSYTRSNHLELSLPAFKALANLDEDYTKVNGVYGNHIYLLSPVYRESSEAEFDVVFVHGLVGSVFKSWRQGSVSLDEFGNRKNSSTSLPTTELLPTGPDTITDEQTLANGQAPITRCWPKDWLAKDIPGLRVLAVDYPSALSSWRTDCDTDKDTLRERAIHVMEKLAAANVGEKPIVWVAHSMGGLLVKQILVLCDERREQLSKNNGTPAGASRRLEDDLLKQTKGIVFYSVPHKGSNLGWIERRNLQKLLLLTTEVIELQKGSPVLMSLHEKFLDVIKRNDNNIKFLTYLEDSISSFGVNKVVQWKGVLVHEDSLRFEIGPNYKLKIDHAHTCKPHDKEAITYIRTLHFIRDLIPVKKEQEDEKLMPYISFVL